MYGYCGGSLKNRAKFPLAVLNKVRKTVGTDFMLELGVFKLKTVVVLTY